MDLDAILQSEIDRWIDTPFSPNGAIPGPGGGVSCQQLLAAFFRARGLVLDVPVVSMKFWRTGKVSLVETFLDARPEFERVRPGFAADAQVWDIIGFRLGRIIHHLGLCVGPMRFIHAIDGQGVVLASLFDATWITRVEGLWRIKI